MSQGVNFGRTRVKSATPASVIGLEGIVCGGSAAGRAIRRSFDIMPVARFFAYLALTISSNLGLCGLERRYARASFVGPG